MQTNPGDRRLTLYQVSLVGLLGLANALSFLDRGFINLVVEPIRKTLALSDMQMGLLIGPAFMILYTGAALLIGRLADQFNRKYIVISGLLIWSICTSATAFASSYLGAALARMGVGVGEATLNPAAISILSDSFPRQRVSRAVAIFIALGTFGSSLGIVLGGLLLAWLKRANHSRDFFFSGAPWQQAFVLLGLPGILLSFILLFVVHEPQRSRLGEASPPAYSWRQTLTYLWAHGRSIPLAITGFALISICSAGGVWTPTLFSRVFDWGPEKIGPALGLIHMVANPAGVILGGFLSDIVRARGREDANILIILCAELVALPCQVLYPLMPSPGAALALLGVSGFFVMICFGASTPSLLLITPSRMRAQILAIMLLSANVMGLGIGPVLYPALTQYVFHDPLSLRFALAIVPGIVLPVSMLLLIRCRSAFIAQAILIREEHELAAS